ncbi:D-alanine--D-alanine ligase [Candidatus Saccharibacteria bacterium]|nr:D-alanine--D-alanine ligase [Candidatus Saccharibacteria bacterium]
MKTVLLLFGGESTEHEVSVASAVNVDQALDKTKFTVIYSYIDRSGVWWHVDSVKTDLLDDSRQLLPQFGRKSFIVEGTDNIISPDIILPILHGRNGEDGSVQAVAQLVHIPIVGCDMTSSAAAMNKYITKQVAIANNIRVVPFTVHYETDAVPDFEEMSLKLGPVLFVKPANAGSSVGVYKVTNQDELRTAIEGAHAFDDIVLIETAIHARELEIAVLGNYPHIEASAVAEIKPQGEFYSYESKYDELSRSLVVIPADISPELSDDLRRQAALIFHMLGCSGMARVDFFIDSNTHDIYLNEVNTIPGFTDISVYPKTWEHAGISYQSLIERLIELALEK